MWFLIVLAVLAGLIVLLLLVLCVPVDVVIEWDSTKHPRIQLTLLWLFGLIRFAPGKKRGMQAESRREKKVRKRPGLIKVLKIITTRGLFGKVASLVKSSLRKVRIAELEGDIKLELDDPADAGFVYGVLGAAYPILRLTRLNQIRIEPVLGEEVMVRGNARALIGLQPIRLVLPLLKFIFSRPAFLAMKTAVAD